MPLTYSLDDDVITVAAIGDVDYETGLGVLTSALDAARSVRTDGAWHIVFDLREATEKHRTADELRNIARLVAANRDVLSGRGLIVANDNLHFGLGRMFQVFASDMDVHIRVSTSWVEGEEWLRNPDAEWP